MAAQGQQAQSGCMKQRAPPRRLICKAESDPAETPRVISAIL